jgi:hypothetical protein
MMTETLVFGLLPTVVAVSCIIGSVFVTIRARGFFHFVASTVVIASAGWSLLILYRIFFGGAWPTYLPHIVIGVALVITLGQVVARESQQER